MSNRFLTGRRTGTTIRKDVSKDEEGFDDINSFWGDKPKDLGNSNQISPVTGENNSKGSSRFSTSSRLSIVDTPSREYSTSGDVSAFNPSPNNFAADEDEAPTPSPAAARKSGKKYNLNDDDDSSEEEYESESSASDSDNEVVEKDLKREQKLKKKQKKAQEKKKRKKAAEKEAKKRKKEEAKRKREASKKARDVSFEEDEDAAEPTTIPGMQYVPVTDAEDGSPNDSDDDEAPRRSKRRRFEPLQYWKNERLLFKPTGAVDNLHKMEEVEVIATLAALPTPAKQARPAGAKRGAKHAAVKAEGKVFNPRNLEYDVEVNKESTVVWDETTQTNKQRKIVVRADTLTPSDLPITHQRPDGNDTVGSAAQAFNIAPTGENMPGWISGNLSLPPNAIKDAEGVGECTQVFFVQSCQPGAFEVALNDPDEEAFNPESANRFTMKSGDFFHVPPNNIYRIQNHSDDVDAKLFWVIIKAVDA